MLVGVENQQINKNAVKMTDGDSLMLNLSCDTVTWVHKQRISKQDRLKQKREERRSDKLMLDRLVSEQVHVTKDVVVPRKPPPSHKERRDTKAQEDKSQSQKKRKRLPDNDDEDDSEVTAKKYKSTLFHNNPEIPKLDKVSVKSVAEKIFSGESFNDLNLHEFMVSNLEKGLGVTTATSVQKATIPQILTGNDVLVKSQTGSGKTLAYAVPIVQQLQSLRPKIQRSDGTHVLVIVPTRELALQSLDTFQKLVKPFTWIVPGSLMGGEKKKSEKARLRKGLNILISTPGRLMDHIENTRSLELARINWLVIDEADRLLDLGFEKEISQIIMALKERGSKERKTALLSATLSTGVERLAGMSLNTPVKIDLTTDQLSSPGDVHTDSQDSTFATPEHLKHHCVVIPSKLRLVTLAAFILWKCKMAAKRSKMLVFMSTQDAVDFHYRLFHRTLFVTDDEEEVEEADNLLYRLHGEMPQKERTQVFKKFSSTDSGVLFCTDVAARGLDLPQVRWIVQYMSPGGSTDYIHRVGRTARIGSRGNALLFLTPAETGFTKLLAESNIDLTEVEMKPILQTLLVEKHKLHYLWEDSEPPYTIEEAASLLQVRFTEHVRLDRESRTRARKAYQSYIGAYTAYPNPVKHIFHVKNLHLGHVATSFGLQEAPTKIGNIVGTQLKKHNVTGFKQKPNVRKGSLAASMHRSNVSEFSSGDTTKISSTVKLTKKEKKKLHSKTHT